MVDDDPAMTALIGTMMRAAGYEVATFTRPSEALAFAEAGETFDLAVLDVVMPELSGERLAALLRRRNPDLPVLYVTGYDEALFQAHPVLWKNESFLTKPFRMNSLLEAVAMALYGRTSPPES